MRDAIWIGTRGSKLALWQAHWIKSGIEKNHPGLQVHLKVIHTSGDKILDVPLAQVGGKGLFVKEIEEELLEDEIDLAVHSMKDVPSDLPDGLHLAFYTSQDDPRDVLVSQDKIGFLELPRGGKVGTSSLRRQAQLLSARPDLQIRSIRGNVETRLRKLEEENLDAVIMAAAGLKRLGFEDRITEYLDPEISLPAVGQGVLGVELRKDDLFLHKILAFLEEPETRIRMRAERSFLKRLEGGCQVPIGALARVADGGIVLKGMVSSLDGQAMIRESIQGAEGEAEELGLALADRILSLGGREILEEVYQ
ncbi:MAG: hydroxymethylbilane synthase [Nitrospirae bacterium]|nr:hydroxymethylbilane synthase [Nitrospirota bacterium]MBI3594894.1 hydroxymethylbilane synthase [Nitrospirota bacterium]